MIKHFLALAVLCSALLVEAQMPGNIAVDGRLVTRTIRPRSSCANYAGTVHFGLFNGQSNTVGDKLVFLCANDSLDVIHYGDYNLDGDPEPFTPSGIRYAYYDCPPTISGPSLSDILQDDCLNHTSPVFVNGQPIVQSKGIWITTGGTPGGNLKLYNRGQLQQGFAQGKPVSFWFAPITVDDFANSEFEADPVTGEAGACVQVNPTAAFEVVYLNPIKADGVMTNVDGQGCQGSFVVSGGLPEYDSNGIYSIRIELIDNPDIQGYVLNAGRPGNLDTVRFFVPQPGDYQIVVEDGKSCEAVFSVDMSGCNAVELGLPFLNRLPGDSVCMEVKVKGFDNVGTLELDFSWDPSVIRFTGVSAVSDSLSGFGAGNIGLSLDSAQLNLSWLDPAFGGVSLQDDATLLSLCFVVVGQIGDKSPVRILPSNIPSETIGTPEPKPLGFILNAGQINVSSEVLFFDVTPDSVDCQGGDNGGLSITVAGGKPFYSVVYKLISSLSAVSGTGIIPSSGGNLQVSGLPAGLYEVRVRDSNSPVSMAIDTVEIFAPPLLAVRLEATDPSCYGNSDGSIQAVVLINSVPEPNPGAAYAFRWSIPGETADRLDNLRGGFYAVTVTNSVGCISTASTNLSPPAAIQPAVTLTNATCSGVADGSIVLTAKGGNSVDGRYLFSWEGQAPERLATLTRNNLRPGTYCVVISDDNNCETTQCFTIGANKVIDFTATIRDATCNGECDGSIMVLGQTMPASAAQLPYRFTWSKQGNSAPFNTNVSSSLQDLCAGQYIVTMVDSDPAGCSVVDTLILGEPAPLVVTQAALTNETCVMGLDGSVTVQVEGGTSPYTYLWNNGSRDSIAANLSAGRYTLEVRDINGCMDSFEALIQAPTPPQIISFEHDTLQCASDTNGALFVNARDGGAAISAYTWSNGATGPAINNLVPGVYTVTILAADGCQTKDTALVVAPLPLRVDSIGIESPRCPGEANGKAVLFVGGGTAPYRYIWAGSMRNDTTSFPLRPGLSAGNYGYTVTDTHFCPGVSGTVQVEDPAKIMASYSNIKAVSCFETVCDGAITATGGYSDGSSGRFTFTWQSGEVFNNTGSSRAVNLCSGRNTVVLVDSNFCSIIDTVDIPSPEEIKINFDASTVRCNAGSDGQILAQVSGGIPGYAYLWVELGVGGNQVSGLTAGTYTLRINDANGCAKEAVYEMRQPDQLILSVDPNSTNNARCFGGKDGRIRVVVNTQDSINPLGDTPYSWSGAIAASNTDQAVMLAAGDYAVTVTDVKGCQAVLNYSILEPEPIVAVIPTPDEPLCFGSSTSLKIDTIYGGNGGSFLDYIFSINNTGLSFSPNQAATVFAGELIVTIEDPLGCSLTDTLTVTQPEELRVVFDPSTLVVELGDTLTALDPIIIGSTPVDSFIWSPAANLTSIHIRNPYIYNLLDDQTFKLTVIDINGCKASEEIFVELDRNRNVYIPNVFSPNGDGWNDELRLFACKGVTKVNYAVVYDRWGGQVYESREVRPDCLSGAPLWDGTVGGKTVPAGVYVYVIEVEFLDGVVLLYRGDVTVFR